MTAEYRCFTDDNMGQVWAKHTKEDQIIILKNIPYYRGMIISNEISKQKVIDSILLENGIKINKPEINPSVPWNHHTYENWREAFPESTLFSINDNDQVSENGVTYKYFLLPEEGGGWGVLLKKENGNTKLITEGRLTNITSGLSQLLLERKVDFDFVQTHLKDIRDFTPTPSDF